MLHGQPNIEYQHLLRVIVLFPSTTVKIFKFCVILCLSLQCPAECWIRWSRYIFKRMMQFYVSPCSALPIVPYAEPATFSRGWQIIPGCYLVLNGTLNCANGAVNCLSKVETVPVLFAAKILRLCHKIIPMQLITNKNCFYNKPELLCYFN
jgi:hypothetical protein